MMNNSKNISNGRLFLGGAIFIIGFMSPLFIPLVTNSELSIEWKTGISGFLAFGIPEIFMVIAISIMGKPGYEFIKSKLVRFIKPLAPKDRVSLTRYRIGLIMFSLPILFGWIAPYLSSFYPYLKNIDYSYYIIGDIIFIASFFVLGGEFWDRLSGLFKYNSK